MLDLILTYLAGALLTVSVMTTWSQTAFKIHLFSMFLSQVKHPYYDKEVCDTDDWENYMLLKMGILGELVTCHYCLAHWVGLIASSIIMCLSPVPFNTPLVLFSMFTYPWFVGEYIRRLK